MKIGDKYEVTVEKMTNLGLGLAHIDNMAVFIENACPEDKIKIEITKINKHYTYGRIIEIITPSPHRQPPFCPMQKVCGACQIQFINYDYQLELKQEIVQETMNKIGQLDIKVKKTVPSPNIKGYRHKIQYPVSETKNSKRIISGYYKSASHEIVNIKYCPIQPEICDYIINFIRENASKYSISGYNEKSHTGDLRHIVIRHSRKYGNSLVCLVFNNTVVSDNYKNFAKAIYSSFETVSGVCVNLNNKKTNIILGEKTICLEGKDYIEEEICAKTFKIGPETFFQVNPESAQNIFYYIKEFIKNNYTAPDILDAYAGISSIGICLSDVSQNVVTIEDNLKSVALAKETIALNNISNVEIHGGDANKFLQNEKRKFDIIILDPPRKGCNEESLNYAMKLCKGHIIYVSCNPATLARDLKYLNNKNAIVESIQPFDMFCHTYHIENVAIVKV